MTPRTAKPHAAPLAGLSVDQFMRRHWQRKPLLIRQAIPGFEAPLDPDALIELAGDDSVESRLIARRRGRWRLEHGPFDAEQLPPLSGRDWTLLVQGVDLHSDAVHALLSRFRFVPDARLDDLMISLAADGGGVGPHVDSYDVFLLQAWGRRRWQIGRVAEPRFVPGLPLRILADFEAEQEWLLEPGDMLYLPPGWGHDGVAEGPCMTCSIGFRAPSRHEFLAAFLAEAADAPGGPDPRFADRGRAAVGAAPSAPARATVGASARATAGAPAAGGARRARRADPSSAAQIPDDLHGALADWARRWRPSVRQVDEFIGRYLSEPKPNVWFDADAPVGARVFAVRARRHGLALDRRTRMLWRGNTFYINGEALPAPAGGRALLRQLAEQRRLGPGDLQTVADEHELLPILHEWHKAGWLRLPAATKPP